MDRGAWWATVQGVKRVRHDLATKQEETGTSAVAGAGSTMLDHREISCPRGLIR